MYTKQRTIWSGCGWTVISYGNGAAYDLKHVNGKSVFFQGNGKSVFFQGDDAEAFWTELEAASRMTHAHVVRVFGQYEGVMS